MDKRWYWFNLFANTDPLDIHGSKERIALINLCIVFFKNNKLKGLPRNQHLSRAIDYTKQNVLPRIVEIYGSLEFFFKCVEQSSKVGSNPKVSDQRTFEDGVRHGRKQMANSIQKIYDEDGNLFAFN